MVLAVSDRLRWSVKIDLNVRNANNQNMATNGILVTFLQIC